MNIIDLDELGPLATLDREIFGLLRSDLPLRLQLLDSLPELARLLIVIEILVEQVDDLVLLPVGAFVECLEQILQ